MEKVKSEVSFDVFVIFMCKAAELWSAKGSRGHIPPDLLYIFSLAWVCNSFCWNTFCIWPLWLRGTLSCRTSSFIVGTGFLPLKPWNKLLPWKGTPCDSIYTMKFPGELQSKQFCIAVFTALGWHGATHQHSVFLRGLRIWPAQISPSIFIGSCRLHRCPNWGHVWNSLDW